MFGNPYTKKLFVKSIEFRNGVAMVESPGENETARFRDAKEQKPPQWFPLLAELLTLATTGIYAEACNARPFGNGTEKTQAQS